VVLGGPHPQSRTGGSPIGRFRTALNVTGVLVLFVALWEGYRALALALDNTWPGTDAALPIVVRGSGNAQSFPHLWDIVAALGQPYRGGGETLGAFLLSSIGHTAREVAVGFVLGVVLGFLLGVLFRHSSLAERALMPYVVASQVVPFIAFAPILVVVFNQWQFLPSWAGVAVLSMYLVFFPVTINTVRGLRAAEPTAEELMRSYAVGWWTRLWKLRFPAALPHIFVGMKIGATAAVVGAIVGEISAPSSEGIGGAIFAFGRVSNNAVQLFATTIAAGLLGISAYLFVVGLERFALRSQRGAAT
jgi:NitT/TauT family transport system permease protein